MSDTRPVVRLLVLGPFAEARRWTVLVELSVMEQRIPGGWERDRPMHLWQMDVMGRRARVSPTSS